MVTKETALTVLPVTSSKDCSPERQKVARPHRPPLCPTFLSFREIKSSLLGIGQGPRVVEKALSVQPSVVDRSGSVYVGKGGGRQQNYGLSAFPRSG